MFGCGDYVVFDLMDFMQDNDEVPGKGEINYMLLALMFMEIYFKERTMRSLIRESDPKRFINGC